jgi:hypothetical protein
MRGELFLRCRGIRGSDYGGGSCGFIPLSFYTVINGLFLLLFAQDWGGVGWGCVGQSDSFRLI